MKKNLKEKLVSSWKEFIKEPIIYSLLFISVVMYYGLGIFLCASIIFDFHDDLTDKYLGIMFGAFFLLIIYAWLRGLLERFKAKRESAAKSIKVSENRPPQNLEKSPPSKDQDDHVIVAKGKKEKSLYQRLRELPLSKDRVGQSFIIVRGGHVGKPGNGDGGGGDINNSTKQN